MRLKRILERRAVARQWGVAPWQIDEAPHGEVLLELQLLEIEARNRPPSKR